MTTVPGRRKLIEVALPLDAVNAAAAREKAIRHGHPSTLHLWWARRPPAAARAVIFAQMVDDPSEYLDELLSDPATKRAALRALESRPAAGEGPPADSQAIGGRTAADGPADRHDLREVAARIERERLFRIIEALVQWGGRHDERGGAAAGQNGDLEELAPGVRPQRRPSPCSGAFRPGQAARVPRSVRRWGRPAARGAAAGARGPRRRPQSGGRAHQQGDDRDPAQVRGPAAGEPGIAGRGLRRRRDLVGSAGAGRGRAPLRPPDARRSGKADWAPVSEGGDHARRWCASARTCSRTRAAS